MKFDIAVLRRYWWVLALIAIFLFCYWIRAATIVPDRMLSFDPIFQYRFTKYVTDFGTIPAWDELSYYAGRADTPLSSGFMWYLTAAAYKLFGAGQSLKTIATHMAAIYGALIAVAAFALVRELSNNKGGLIAAVLIGTAPQILIRTFGSSYDTDQIVLFFLLATLWAGIYAMRHRTPRSIAIAILTFTAAVLAWPSSVYTVFILLAGAVIYLVAESWPSLRKLPTKETVKEAFSKLKGMFGSLAAVLIGIIVSGIVLQRDILGNMAGIVGFAQAAEQLIVNISIAELQPFSIFNLSGWILAMGRFVTNETVIDLLVFFAFFALMIYSLIAAWKRDRLSFAMLAAIFLTGIYITFRGMRFTEFSSAQFLILVGAGYGLFADWASNRKGFVNIITLGIGALIVIFALSLGWQIGNQLGPDISPNWDNAWEYLRTQTPELSLVGTWWDPGHMITGLADRRVIADGAHCSPSDCMYSINDRIADLGRVMAQSDENLSVQLIQKYRGTSPKAYWIASDDLIGKFQWVQYFGTGCDARSEARCPLYQQIPLEKAGTTPDGKISIKVYSSIYLFEGNIPIPVYTQGRIAAFFDEILFYENETSVRSIKMDQIDPVSLNETKTMIQSSLNLRFSNQTVPTTVWIPNHRQFIVMIPPTLRDAVFTKMFMLEGTGLQNFKQVFRNENVKIYEVLFK